MRKKFYVIGIDDNQEQHFSPEVKSLIAGKSVFSGGKRHRDIVMELLPENYNWIEIKIPLEDVFAVYDTYSEVVVFASGDPLFFGFANTIQRLLPDAEIILYPYFNSLQLLAHRLLMPYQDMRIVSLTGRPWLKLDEALIKGSDKIGVLTDNKLHTPSEIAKRMLYYGYNNYSIAVGELLGNKEKERVSEWQLTDIVDRKFSFPNNLILRKERNLSRPFGIPENEFELLNGRAKMITKMPIRLLSLCLLELREKTVFWDVGACTGSVSIEAKMQFPHLEVVAFEIRDEGKELIENNSRKFGTPGIDVVIGDFTTVAVDNLPKPDAVFIGGHGGKMDEMVAKIAEVISEDGVLVFNSVSEESKNMFLQAISQNNWTLDKSMRITIDDHNTIEVMKAKRTII